MMQHKLFELFRGLEVDDKKLSAISMLCVVGTPNTKTGKIRSIVGEADEILTYQDFAKRLALNFGEVHDNHEEASKHEQHKQKQKKLPERSPLEVTDTHEEIDKPNAEVEEIEASKVHEVQKTASDQPDERAKTLQEQSGDLSRLHHGSNNWVCLCTENKVLKGECGKWTEYWIPANRILDALSTLRLKVRDLDEFNVYVSQLEFSERRHKVEYVAAFRACFVDIDGKIAGGNLTAEEWKNLILKFCHEKKIPIPSEMVFSGNEVHVKYFFDRLMTRKEFPRWENLERKLADSCPYRRY